MGDFAVTRDSRHPRGIRLTEAEYPHWRDCSDPPPESCADAGCPEHGDYATRPAETGDDDGRGR